MVYALLSAHMAVDQMIKVTCAVLLIVSQLFFTGKGVIDDSKSVGDEHPNTSEWTLAKPNEMGEIMIVMYHRLAEKEGTYDRSIAHFKEDLNRLYNEGYRPVSLRSVVEGTIDLPAGLSPVVLTFDDGHISNFKLEESGDIAPDSVVGILLDFQETHPDFPARGVFYITGPSPFGQSKFIESKLKLLNQMGFEVGNHTASHKRLSGLNASQITEEIGVMNDRIITWSGVESIHLSLPYGLKPKSVDSKRAVIESMSDLYHYTMRSVVNVGWKPIPSPYDKTFDPFSLNRVICGDGEYSMHYWMDYFETHPERKYISDGDMDFISITKNDLENLKESLKGEPQIRWYQGD